MVISEYVEISWTNSNKIYFLSKDYLFSKNGNKFLVKVNDLSNGSHIRIDLICDYCNKHFNKQYNKYISEINRNIVQKDSCNGCKNIKLIEANLAKHGVENVNSIKVDGSIIDIEYVRKEFIDRNYQLLSNEYINNLSELLYICNIHNDKIQKTNYCCLHSGSGCFPCSIKSRSDKKGTILYMLEKRLKNSTFTS